MDILILFLFFLFFFMAIGLPMAFAIGLSGLFLMFYAGHVQYMLVARRMITGINQFTLLAIPFFMLTGELMNKAGIVKDLANLSQALVGWISGGLAYVNVVVSMFFAGITGSAVADTSAVGSLLIPMMNEEGYDNDFSCAITAASSVIGPIIPPSTPMIIYSLIAGVSVAELFLAGIVPGVLIGILLCATVFVFSKKRGYPKTDRVPFVTMIKAVLKSIPGLMLPIIILGGVLTGFFTATEAAAVAAAYALIVSITIFGMPISEIPSVFLETAKRTSIVMFVCSAAMISTWILSAHQVPFHLTSFLMGITENRILILLILNVFLIAIGSVIDLTPALFIVVPVLAPVGVQLGLDPVHFAAIVVVNLTIGLITPPVGTVLYVACSVGDIEFKSLAKAIAPMFLAMIVTLIVTTYFTDLVMFFPRLFR